jgi:ferritin
MTDTKLINQLIADIQKRVVDIKTPNDVSAYLLEQIEGLKILKKELDDFRLLKELLKRTLS